MPEIDVHDQAIRKKVLMVVASGGGHCEQLKRLFPAFAGCKVHFVTTLRGSVDRTTVSSVSIVRDASQTKKISVLILAVHLTFLILRLRPEIIISTGAAPGMLAIRIGKHLGARTLWLDSIANVDKLSMSGLLARKYADVWLTQWPHLVPNYEGLQYKGKIF